jgi:hypothetical protein
MVNIISPNRPNAYIEFDKQSFEEFKKLVEENSKLGNDHVFDYKGHKVLVAYAKYMIKYIEEVKSNV